jgi:hypothetical protein
MGFKKEVQRKRQEVKDTAKSIDRMVDSYDLGYANVIENALKEDGFNNNLSIILLGHFIEQAQSFEDLTDLRTFISKPLLNPIYEYCLKKVSELDEIERLAEIEHKKFENSHYKEL